MMFLQSYSESCVCDKLRLLCSCCLKYEMARCRARHMAASIWMLALYARTKQGLGMRCGGEGNGEGAGTAAVKKQKYFALTNPQ